MRRQDALRDWLKQNKHWVYADPAKNAEDVRSRPLTHVFYDGGRAAVPPGPPRARFLEVYADALALGEKPRVAEMTPPDAPFHAFADLDTKHRCRDREDDEDDHALAARMLGAFRKVGGQEFSRAVVCTKARPGSRGVHVTWLENATDEYRPVMVTRERMMRLREQCVRELTEDDSGAAWGEMFDAAVYSRRQATLRMVFSRSKDGQDDHYVPSLLWRAEGDGGESGCVAIADAAADVHAWVKRCSILPVEEAPCCPSCPDDDDEAEGGDSRKRRRRSFTSTIHHVAAPEMRKRIEGLMKLLPEPYYRGEAEGGVGARVTGVTERDHVIILKLDSRYCHNVGREHTSSRVYLQIDKHGVGQRCFCTRDTVEGREFGPCAEINLPLCEHGTHPFSDLIDAKLAEAKRRAEEEEKENEERQNKKLRQTSVSAQRRPATVLQAVDAMREKLRQQRVGGIEKKKVDKRKKRG